MDICKLLGYECTPEEFVADYREYVKHLGTEVSGAAVVVGNHFDELPIEAQVIACMWAEREWEIHNEMLENFCI